MTYFEDAFERDSGFSPVDALDIAEDDYRELFDEYWGINSKEAPSGLDFDEWLEYRKLHGLATEMATAAASLLKRKGLGQARLSLPDVLEHAAKERQKRVDDVLKQLEPHMSTREWWRLFETLLPYAPSDPRTRHNFFRNSLQLGASKLFPHNLGDIARRLQILVGYLVRYPNERAAAYLSRVAECYVRGQKTELAVMARAVLDAALQDLVDDEIVRAKVGSGDHVTLERRIAYCEAVGILNGDSAAAATQIRLIGRDAVHTAPGLEPEPEVILRFLVVSLEVITKK